jgi:voltage-dependent potassium channel beta subunit
VIFNRLISKYDKTRQRIFDMEYRKLGHSGLKVSTVSFGGWINYGEGKVALDEAHRVVEVAYGHGINYFDLADVYGRGEAEKQMGAVLQQYPRHSLVIATKVYWPMSDDINDRGLSRKHIMESINKSLKRLGTDYVDLYFCHRYDPETPLYEVCRAMDDLVSMGKILYWGTSEWAGEQIAAACEICAKHNFCPPQVEQPQYSMLYRERVETDVLPVTSKNGLGLVVWSPLAMGMLTGKYDEGIPEDSRFARESWAKERYVTSENAARVKALKAISDGLGITRSQLALAWALRDPNVTSTIVGATKASQLEDNVKASGVHLSAETVAQVEEVLGNKPV